MFFLRYNKNMNMLEKIKKWPASKKRFFSITLAIFLTILIIILNSALNLIWKEEQKNNYLQKDKQVKEIKDTFSKIINDTKYEYNLLKTDNMSTTTEEIE